ncbi:hypothetical protein ACWCXB_29230 [Streptomyces sp. NPDC001514]
MGTHVPVPIERFADQRLGALAKASGLSAKPVPGVLFVCAENAGRSQLAAACCADGPERRCRCTRRDPRRGATSPPSYGSGVGGRRPDLDIAAGHH